MPIFQNRQGRGDREHVTSLHQAQRNYSSELPAYVLLMEGFWLATVTDNVIDRLVGLVLQHYLSISTFGDLFGERIHVENVRVDLSIDVDFPELIYEQDAWILTPPGHGCFL